MALVLGLLRLVFSQLTFLLVIPFTLASLHWELALAALATLPFVVAVPLVMGRAMGHAWQEVMGVHGALGALQVETLRQSRTTKVLALEPFIYQRAAGLMQSVLRAHLGPMEWKGSCGCSSARWRPRRRRCSPGWAGGSSSRAS